MNKKESTALSEHLSNKGYKCLRGHYKKEDYGYWKSFDVSGDDDKKKTGYQVAVLFYDWTKYKDRDPSVADRIGVSFEALFNHSGTGRYDFSVSDESYTIERFEEEMEKVYQLLKSKLQTA